MSTRRISTPGACALCMKRSLAGSIGAWAGMARASQANAIVVTGFSFVSVRLRSRLFRGICGLKTV
jgi:hypothetical protein